MLRQLKKCVYLRTCLSPGIKHIATKSRRFSEEDRGFYEESVEKLLADDVIRPSSSPRYLSLKMRLIVIKSDNKQVCVDYSQTINIYTELDAYPLPRIDDLVKELAKYSVFSTSDLCSAYHLIKIAAFKSKYNAFKANSELYEFTRITFGEKWCCDFPTSNNAIHRGGKARGHICLFG